MDKETEKAIQAVDGIDIRELPSIAENFNQLKIISNYWSEKPGANANLKTLHKELFDQLKGEKGRFKDEIKKVQKVKYGMDNYSRSDASNQKLALQITSSIMQKFKKIKKLAGAGADVVTEYNDKHDHEWIDEEGCKNILELYGMKDFDDEVKERGKKSNKYSKNESEKMVEALEKTRENFDDREMYETLTTSKMYLDYDPKNKKRENNELVNEVDEKVKDFLNDINYQRSQESPASFTYDEFFGLLPGSLMAVGGQKVKFRREDADIMKQFKYKTEDAYRTLNAAIGFWRQYEIGKVIYEKTKKDYEGVYEKIQPVQKEAKGSNSDDSDDGGLPVGSDINKAELYNTEKLPDLFGVHLPYNVYNASIDAIWEIKALCSYYLDRTSELARSKLIKEEAEEQAKEAKKAKKEAKKQAKEAKKEAKKQAKEAKKNKDKNDNVDANNASTDANNASTDANNTSADTKETSNPPPPFKLNIIEDELKEKGKCAIHDPDILATVEYCRFLLNKLKATTINIKQKTQPTPTVNNNTDDSNNSDDGGKNERDVKEFEEGNKDIEKDFIDITPLENIKQKTQPTNDSNTEDNNSDNKGKMTPNETNFEDEDNSAVQGHGDVTPLDNDKGKKEAPQINFNEIDEVDKHDFGQHSDLGEFNLKAIDSMEDKWSMIRAVLLTASCVVIKNFNDFTLIRDKNRDLFKTLSDILFKHIREGNITIKINYPFERERKNLEDKLYNKLKEEHLDNIKKCISNDKDLLEKIDNIYNLVDNKIEFFNSKNHSMRKLFTIMKDTGVKNPEEVFLGKPFMDGKEETPYKPTF